MRERGLVAVVVFGCVACSGAERGGSETPNAGGDDRDATVVVGMDGGVDEVHTSGIVINEVVAASPEGDAVELLNLSASPVDLGGFFVTDDPEGEPQKAALPAGTVIAAGAYFVLPVGDLTVGFGLGSDEAFGLFAADGARVDVTDWAEGDAIEGTSWGRLPNGTGAFRTLGRVTLGAPNADGDTPPPVGGEAPPPVGGDDPPPVGGDPPPVGGDPPPVGGDPPPVGGNEPPPGPAPDLILNEVVAEGGDVGDWVEIYNPGRAAVSLDGLFLTDDFAGEPLKGAIPAGESVPPGGWLVVFVNDDTVGFKLSGDEAVALVAADGTVIDETDWAEGEAAAGASWGRFPDHAGPFRTLAEPTPGAENRDGIAPPPSVCGDGDCAADETERGCAVDCAPETPLVINEVVAAGDPDDSVEFYNGTNAPIDLVGWFISDDPEGDPMQSVFVESLVIEPRGYLVLVVSDENVGFRLGGNEGFSLTDPDGTLVDSTTWQDGDSPGGGSWARQPDGVGDFATADVATMGQSNDR
jgi:hypothetical protein